MRRAHFSWISCVAALALSVAPGCPGDGPEEQGGEPDGGQGPALDDLLDDAGAAICDALYRCCPSEDELSRFFAPITGSDPSGVFADLIPRLPPNAALFEQECPAVVAAIHGIKGVGPFIRAATDGLVTYDRAAAKACIDALDGAACGDEAIDALFDGTCFSLQPPEGGALQRSMFGRTTTSGACRSLADGFGALFFGTCDPNEAFCCVDQGNGECGFPGADDVGTCVPAAAEDDACSPFNPVLVCQTGLECIPGAGVNGEDSCVAQATAPLALGAPCYDEQQFRLLGECTGGWCDATGTNVCEPRRDDGADCQAADQCISLGCVDGTCGVDGFCSGS